MKNEQNGADRVTKEKGLKSIKKLIFKIMARIHEYIATVIAVAGIYLVLVYFSIFEYTARLYTYIPDKSNLLPIGLLLVLISYLVSPWVWGMVMSRIKQFAR